jgi:FMN phosphatase YigB (HAD superfamily)
VIRALTFDVWDTLVVDDSDEAERARRGLLPKPAAREAAFVAAVGAETDRSPEAARAAWQAAHLRFRHQWKVEHRTPAVADRVLHALGLLDVPTLGGLDALIDELAWMEVRIPPRLTAGIAPVLEALSGRYRLGIISDAIVTPGTGLRQILGDHGILRFFDAPVFSDEAGASKPSPVVFHAAAAGLGVDVREIVHLGDREANDIAGPQGVGARAILYTGAVDRRAEAGGTSADAVCGHWDELSDLLAHLERPA